MAVKCVIVEDALFIREIYRFFLQGQGIDIVAEASDGLDALEKIKLHQPDLIILDLVLPLKNGLDVLKEVSEISSQSKCLVISSVDDEEIRSKALALGAIQYVFKPFTKTQLLDAVNLVIQKYQEVQNG